MNNWKIKQIGEIAKSGVGYHTITNNSLNVGMIDIWFGKYQSIETPEEALKVAKLVEKAPQILEMLSNLLDALDNVNLDFEAEEFLVPLMKEAEEIIKEVQ